MIKSVGAFRIIEFIYSNGTNVTYWGTNAMSQKVIITGFLPEKFQNDPQRANNFEYCEMLEKFKKDFHSAYASNTGSEIVRSAELVLEGDTAYIISAPLPDNAKSLRTLVAETGSLAYDIAIMLFLPLIRAVDISNKNGFCHEFINPDTIWVCDGRLMLMSFGVLKSFEYYKSVVGLANSLYYSISGKYYPQLNKAISATGINIPLEIEACIMKGIADNPATNYATAFEFNEMLSDRFAHRGDGLYSPFENAPYHGPEQAAPDMFRPVPVSGQGYEKPKKKSGGVLAAIFIIIGIVLISGVVFGISSFIGNIAKIGSYTPIPEPTQTPAQTRTPAPSPALTESEEWDFDNTFNPDDTELATPDTEYGEGLENVGIFSDLYWLDDDEEFRDLYMTGSLVIEPWQMVVNTDYAYEDVAVNGFVSEYDGWVYYRRKIDSRLNFYKERIDGSELTLIKENCAPCFINVNEDGVFYTDASDDYKMFFRTHDGSIEKYIGRGINMGFFNNGEAFFYSELDAIGALVVVDTKSLTPIETYGSGYNSMLKKEGDYIYYIDAYETQQIGRINLMDDSEELLTDYTSTGYDLYGDYMFYIDSDSEDITKYNIQTGQETVIFKGACAQLKVYNGYLYYIDNDDLYYLKRCDFDGNNTETIVPEVTDYFEIINDKIYFISYDYESMAFCTNLDGTEGYYMLGE